LPLASRQEFDLVADVPDLAVDALDLDVLDLDVVGWVAAGLLVVELVDVFAAAGVMDKSKAAPAATNAVNCFIGACPPHEPPKKRTTGAANGSA
jgi:hypothetical protein